MNYIKHIEVTKEIYISRMKRTTFDFNPGVNLVIGPNGSGKSTLLYLLRGGWKSHINLNHVKNPEIDNPLRAVLLEKDGIVTISSFDFEKDNPRGKSTFDDKDMMWQVKSHYSSHGEAMIAPVAEMLHDGMRDKVALLDEPDSAMDLDNTDFLIDCLRNTKASQVIAVVHSPYLMAQPDFHCVEMVEGYKNNCLSRFKNRIGDSHE